MAKLTILLLLCVISTVCCYSQYYDPAKVTPFDEAVAPVHHLERIPPNEHEAISKSWDAVKGGYDYAYQHNNANLRQFHAKTHACVTGTFEILTQDKIDPQLQVGLFATSNQGKKYDVFARYSNGKGAVKADDNLSLASDLSPDVRALSIKLYGDDILANHKKPFVKTYSNAPTVDFIFATPKVFILPSAVEGQAFLETAFNLGSKALLKFIATHLPFGKRLAQMMVSGAALDLTNKEFYTGVPFALGSTTAAEARLIPCPKGFHIPRFPSIFPPKTMFRDRLEEHLKKSDVCYLFQLLKYSDDKNTPMENAGVAWKETLVTNQWTTMAKLTFPRQGLDVSNDYCSRSTWNPWNTISEHQPLGGVQRARRVIYTQAQKMRQAMSGDYEEERTWNDILANKHFFAKNEAEVDEVEPEQAELDSQAESEVERHHSPSHHVSVDVDVNL